MRERLAIVVANHVVHEDDAAELGPPNTALLDLGIHPAVFPVAVRTQNRGHAAALIRRAVKVPAERKPGKRLEDHLFDRVIVTIELSTDRGIERAFWETSARARARPASAREDDWPCRARLVRSPAPENRPLASWCGRVSAAHRRSRRSSRCARDSMRAPHPYFDRLATRARAGPAPAPGAWLASPSRALRFSGVEPFSLEASPVTTTLSDVPLIRFSLPSACHRGSGSLLGGGRCKRDAARFGIESPLVTWRSPDMNMHFAGEPWVDSLGQPGKITRRVKHGRSRGRILGAADRQRRERDAE